MLKFGIRKNNFYPLMLLLFIFLRICLEKILAIHPYKKNIDFLISFLIFISQCLMGCIIYLYYCCRKIKLYERTPTRSSSISSISSYIFWNKTKTDEIKDNKCKTICLVLFASFFNYVGCVIRSADVLHFWKKEDNNSQLEIRIRSIQIIISSLLCYFTLRLNIYRHQKLSLIVISILLVTIITLEFVITSSLVNKILSILLVIVSCLSRAFLDVTEKYLFEYNYINVLSMLIYEGLIGLFFFIIYFLANKTYQDQGINLIKDMSDFNWKFITFILLILIYIVISGFRNVYRITTNKYYSPMSRALFESTFDPFLFIYNFFTLKIYEENRIKWVYFGVVLFSLLVIGFLSLVYNDFLIISCCKLDFNTYRGINSRLGDDNIERKDTIIDFDPTTFIDDINNYEMTILN